MPTEAPLNTNKLAPLIRGCEARGELEKSEQSYRRALAVRGSAADLETAALLNNLAALYQQRGEASRAERLYLRALRMKEKLTGSESAQVAITLNNLAVFYRTVGKFSEARRSYERALSIFQRVLGAMDPNVAAVLSNLAKLMRVEADALEKRAALIEQSQREIGDQEQCGDAVISPSSSRFRLAVRPSRIHRFGVFAKEAIPGGKDIIQYTGERVSRREAVRRSKNSRTYLLRLNSYWRVDGSANGSGAQYINHCCEPNVRFRGDGNEVWCQAIRDIRVGEELTIDYKFSRDAEPVPCYCGAPGCRGTINKGMR